MKLHIRFIKSLYSIKSIAQFRFLGVGSTILYVLLLTLLCILPVLIVFILSLMSDQQTLKNFGNYGLNPDQMQKFASSLDGIFPIIVAVIYMVMYILFSGILFSGVSLIAGCAIPVSNIVGKRLSYRHLWVISCYSITLPSVLLTILFTFNVHIPFSFFWFWLFSFIICVLAIKKITAKK
jgi:hypothetical protein